MQSADSYSALERHFLEPVRRCTFALMRPLVLLLAALGVSPNVVSLSQVPLGLLIFFLMGSRPCLAFVLMVVAILIDGLDGALARHTGRASAYGALVDQYADHVREILVVAGLTYAGALSGVWATLYALAYPGSNLTLYLCNARGVPILVAIKTAFIFYPAFFLYAWFGINYLDFAVGFMVVLMGGIVVQGLWRLRSVIG